MKDMSPDQLRIYAQAIESLEWWAKNVASRDDLIREADKAGVSQTEIARRMKISRNTVATVLGTDEED